MDTLLHWPPRENPNYERERDDYSIWQLEQDIALYRDLAHCCWCRADDLYDCGQIDDAEVMLDLMDGHERRIDELRQRLIKMESGF